MTDLRKLSHDELAARFEVKVPRVIGGDTIAEAIRRLRDDGARIAELEAHIVSEHARNVAHVAKLRTQLDAASVRLGESMDARDELVARISELEAQVGERMYGVGVVDETLSEILADPSHWSCATTELAEHLQSALANVESIAAEMEAGGIPTNNYWIRKLRGAVK